MVAVSPFIQRALIGAERTNAAIRLFPFAHKRKGHYGATSVGRMKRAAVVHQHRTDQDMVNRFPYTPVAVGASHSVCAEGGKPRLTEIRENHLAEHSILHIGIEIAHPQDTGIGRSRTHRIGYSPHRPCGQHPMAARNTGRSQTTGQMAYEHVQRISREYFSFYVQDVARGPESGFCGRDRNFMGLQ